MEDLVKYIEKAQEEMAKASRIDSFCQHESINSRSVYYQEAIYHVLEGTYYQNQAVISLLKEINISLIKISNQI